MTTLNQWRVITADNGCVYLIGIVHEHPTIGDGGIAVTSEVQELADDFSWAQTRNRIYQLLTKGDGELPKEWAFAVDSFLQTNRGARRVRPALLRND